MPTPVNTADMSTRRQPTRRHANTPTSPRRQLNQCLHLLTPPTCQLAVNQLADMPTRRRHLADNFGLHLQFVQINHFN